MGGTPGLVARQQTAHLQQPPKRSTGSVSARHKRNRAGENAARNRRGQDGARLVAEWSVYFVSVFQSEDVRRPLGFARFRERLAHTHRSYRRFGVLRKILAGRAIRGV